MNIKKKKYTNDARKPAVWLPGGEQKSILLRGITTGQREAENERD